MNLKIYSVYDSKAKFFSAPFFCINDDIAIRSFTEATNDSSTQLNKFPEDFSLHTIGTFDPDTGTIHKSPSINLGLASQFKD